jgi:hypothetical protein
MTRRLIALAWGTIFSAGAVAPISPAWAQTFDSYRCADGTHFILTFYPTDKRPYIQIDGHSVKLKKSFSLRGRRYTGGGVSLMMTSAGALLRHLRRPVTACGLI